MSITISALITSLVFVIICLAVFAIILLVNLINMKRLCKKIEESRQGMYNDLCKLNEKHHKFVALAAETSRRRYNEHIREINKIDIEKTVLEAQAEALSKMYNVLSAFCNNGVTALSTIKTRITVLQAFVNGFPKQVEICNGILEKYRKDRDAFLEISEADDVGAMKK